MKRLAEARQKHEVGPARRTDPAPYRRARRRGTAGARHRPVVGGQLHPPREPLAGHQAWRAMRLRHQLRASGRPGGRDQHDRVVLARGTGATDASRLREQPGQRDRCRARDAGQRRHLVVGDDNTRLDLRGEPGQLGLAAARVGGDHDGPDVADGQPGEQVLGNVAGRRQHKIAGAGAGGRERSGRPADPLARLLERVGLVLEPQPELGRACRRPRRRRTLGTSRSLPGATASSPGLAGRRPPQPGRGMRTDRAAARRRPMATTPSPPRPGRWAGMRPGWRPAPPSRR